MARPVGPPDEDDWLGPHPRRAAASPLAVLSAPAAARHGRERRPRLYALDGIRLLAALMVALHHYAGTYRVDRPGNPIWGRPVS